MATNELLASHDEIEESDNRETFRVENDISRKV